MVKGTRPSNDAKDSSGVKDILVWGMFILALLGIVLYGAATGNGRGAFLGFAIMFSIGAIFLPPGNPTWPKQRVLLEHSALRIEMTPYAVPRWMLRMVLALFAALLLVAGFSADR